MNDLEPMHPNDRYLDDEIDFRELVQVLWEGKNLIILITAIVAISSVVYSLSLQNYYKSESIMSVRNNSQNQSILSQYSGAASMLGVNIPTSGVTKTMEVIELIQSRKFVKHLLTFESILPSIMAVKSYDRDSKELLFDPIYNSETKTWNREPNQYGQRKPSYLEAHRVYLTLMSISQDQKTGFVSIHIEHISPVFAKEFLELIIREANALLRNKDMEESSKALEYLKSELSKTSFVEIRESINTLIESQLEIQMMTKINEDYMLVETEPPFIPEKKSKPSRSSIVIFSTIFSGLLSLMIVLVRHYLLGKKITNKPTVV